MEIVRRHRRKVLFVITLFALVAMTLAFLRRVGVDPLAALRPDASEER